MTIGSEFYLLSHVAAIGRRKAFGDGGKGKHEVYIRLTSGSSFAISKEMAKKKCRKFILEVANGMIELGILGFAVAEGGDAFIPMNQVSRIYVDAQGDHYVTIIEDSSGTSCVLEEGDQEKCEVALKVMSETVVHVLTRGRKK